MLLTMAEKKKLLEREKCVLWLATNPGWYRPYELERKEVEREMIGSEADTRMGEMFGNLETGLQTTKVEIKEAEYTVQTKKEGKARFYQAFMSKAPPPRKTYTVREPLTGEIIQVY